MEEGRGGGWIGNTIQGRKLEGKTKRSSRKKQKNKKVGGWERRVKEGRKIGGKQKRIRMVR